VNALCELNVLEQSRNVCRTTVVEDAWLRGQEVVVHGWVYGLHNGLLEDLRMTVACTEDVEPAYSRAWRPCAARAGGRHPVPRGQRRRCGGFAADRLTRTGPSCCPHARTLRTLEPEQMLRTMFPERLTDSRAFEIAQALLEGFNRHYRLFRETSAAAKQRFEQADWLGQQRAQRERIEFYDTRVDEAAESAAGGVPAAR
jgi:hypothetical protein